MQNKGLDEFIIDVANKVKDEIIEERIDIYSDEVFSLKESKILFKEYMTIKLGEIKRNLSLSAEEFYFEVKKILENSKDKFLKELMKETEEYMDLIKDSSLNEKQKKAINNRISLNVLIIESEC
ncbi:hypothetical protein [Aliarcobacter cryaerophilus]|uniref:hypothetical protein n=1 Tax=Aliarcobacter cryaerophilus TaxID=28198 RepID=UPI0021B37DC0|nr:hypothetical protein [Aliarcobacter cryaerophilus]MCT7510962.1 hypothetical protein [Aliarcobacter cryaerophilus]